MKAVGVIVEYNPFHNGHALHLEESKKASGAEVVIAAMSGNFLQRGEPALVSKWTRTKMALQAGVDIVFELPYQYATQQAEIFAFGGVSLLHSAGCESICFGSEAGNIEAFQETYDFIGKHDSLFQQQVKLYMQTGVSYPRALSQAFKDLSPTDTMIDLSKPNNILGFHYLKAAEKLQQPTIKVITVQRKNAGYHDEHFSSSTIASATSIRSALFSEEQQLEKILAYVPESTFKLLNEYKAKYGGFHNWELYWPFFKYKLLQSSPEELTSIYEMEEGIENRLLSTVEKAKSFSEFIQLVKTKRYTWARLQRVCLHVLTNTKKIDMNVLDQPVPYLRLLGMTENGRIYLNKKKQQLSTPLISKLSSYKNSDIEPDIRASRIYNIGLSAGSEELDQDYKETPVYLQKNRN